jgi:hypothetical protein
MHEFYNESCEISIFCGFKSYPEFRKINNENKEFYGCMYFCYRFEMINFEIYDFR